MNDMWSSCLLACPYIGHIDADKINSLNRKIVPHDEKHGIPPQSKALYPRVSRRSNGSLLVKLGDGIHVIVSAGLAVVRKLIGLIA